MKCKKLVALGMTAVMAMSIVACGGGSDEGAGTADTSAGSEASGGEDTGSAGGADSADSAASGVPTIDAITVGGGLQRFGGFRQGADKQDRYR